MKTTIKLAIFTLLFSLMAFGQTPAGEEFVDTGKTNLQIMHDAGQFGSPVWDDKTTTPQVKVSSNLGVNSYWISLFEKSDLDSRYFSIEFSIPGSENGVPAKASNIAYSASTKDKKKEVYFMARPNAATTSGEITLVKETPEKIVFKLARVRIENSMQQALQIDGYIHAYKEGINKPAEKVSGTNILKKTDLLFEMEGSLFDKNWSDLVAKAATADEPNSISYFNIILEFKNDNQHRMLNFEFRFSKAEKVVPLNELSFEYRENQEKPRKGNFFLTSGTGLSGKLELVDEDDKNALFKLTDFKAVNPYTKVSVVINGYVYCKKEPIR